MAAFPEVLRSGDEVPEDERDVRSFIAREVCSWLLHRAANGTIPLFLAIESAESIRDNRSGDAARAMVDFMRRDAGSLDAGIAVCMCEGVEDGLYETADGAEREAARMRLDHARFQRTRGNWLASALPAAIDDIRVFWRDALHAMKHNERRRDHMAHWSNCRLELRRRPHPNAA